VKDPQFSHGAVKDTMADAALVDALGLGMTTLFPNRGALAAQHMPQVLEALALANDEVNVPTKIQLAEGFYLWGTCSDPKIRSDVIGQYENAFFDIIADYAVVEDNTTGTPYRGVLFIAAKLAETLNMIGMVDTTQVTMATYAPLAYATLDKILAVPNLSYEVPIIGSSTESAGIYRTNLCSALMGMMPHSMTVVNVPTAVDTLSNFILGDFPDKLKSDAKNRISSMSTVNAAAVAQSSAMIMKMVNTGKHDDLLFNYIKIPELYTNSPDVVHNNIELFLKQPYLQYSSLLLSVSKTCPSVLVPHLQFFMYHLTSSANMGSIVLSTLSGIAAEFPKEVYGHVNTIITASSSIPYANTILPKLLSHLSVESPETILNLLIDVVEKDNSSAPMVLFEISNMMKNLPDVKVLTEKMTILSKYKQSAEVTYTSIEDFAAG
jgi:uncharacterized protein YejL (UPF0352 family)